MVQYLQDNNWILLLVGSLLVTGWLLSNVARRKRRNQGPAMTGNEQIERNRRQRGMNGQLETLMVEIEQMSKRLGAQLDAKAIHLENLLEQTDAKIRQLQDLADQAAATPPPDPFAAPPPPMVADPGDEPAPASPMGSDDPIAGTIYELADAGMDTVSIARQLDEHVGKIELILALRES